MKVNYHGDAAIAKIRGKVTRGLAAGSTLLATRHKAVLSRPNTGVSKTRTRTTSRGVKGSTYTVYPNSSKPGEPPRLRTGFGRRAVTTKKSDWNQFLIGWMANAFYMALHELGYKPRGGRFQRRPSLFPTLRRSAPAIRAVFAAYAGRKGA
jgi:hypothetical protein